MSKKIIILNGSPRKNGNTSALIDSFIKGAEESGNNVVRFNLQEMDVRPCIGCLNGGKGKDKNSPCTLKDDMDKIYPAFTDADVLVLASPLYYWSFSAQLKMAIDRLFAVTEANNMNTPYKECVMLIAAEEDSENNFAPVIDYYRTIVKNLAWDDRGIILAGGVYRLGDITGKPSLDKARELGASIK